MSGKSEEVEIPQEVAAEIVSPSVEPDWTKCEVESVRKKAQELCEALMGVGAFELREATSYLAVQMLAHKSRSVGAFYVTKKKISFVATRLEVENGCKSAKYDRRHIIEENSIKTFTKAEIKRIAKQVVDYAKRWD